MALKDVRHFYFSTLCQYLEEKQNLADFKEALEAGNITEEQMQDVISAVARRKLSQTCLYHVSIQPTSP